MAERTPEETRRTSEARINAFYDAIPPTDSREVTGLPKRIFLMNARTSAKIRQIHLAADKIFRHATSRAACARGCSHCCHIAVRISAVEARFIGEHIGREPRAFSSTVAERAASFSNETPCTFLKNDECSIYEWRPLTCRSHFNFDQDDYWCRFENWDKPGAAVPKPMIEALSQAYEVASYEKIGDPVMADIRDFFPDGH